jgi:hypothetical protein
MWPPLVAELARCNQTDIEFKMQKVTLRGTLAEALYKVRTVYAPAAKAASPANA